MVNDPFIATMARLIVNKIYNLLGTPKLGPLISLAAQFRLVLLGALVTLGGVAAGAQEDAHNLAALDRVQAGEWELRFRADVSRRRVCMQGGRDFIQLRHPHKSCSQYVVEDLADRVSVQYTCRGDGYGLTNIRVETPGLLQVESQGIAAGSPYHMSAEARRVGPCR